MTTASTNTAPARTPLDPEAVRRDFPILHQEINGKPLAYLDNAASTQKPQRVIDAIVSYYTHDHANVHRGVHTLSQRATDRYEDARRTVARYVNAESPRGVVFTGGNTDSLNLAAFSLGASVLGEGDRIVLTESEHHSNIVPWQMIAQLKGAEIIPAPVTDEGEIDLDRFDALLDERVKIVSAVWVSNVLGTVNPVREIARRAHAVGAKVVIDGAQIVPHLAVDVQAEGIDVLTLAGHKAFGPTGIGAFVASPELLASMPPYRGGGEMIASVSFAESTYAEPPARFEAGTPNIAGAVGFAEALRYVTDLGIDRCAAYEGVLREHGRRVLSEVEGVRFIGDAPGKAPTFTMAVEGCHPYDLGPLLDSMGIAVRTGHHCAEPLMHRFGVTASLRASAAIYNTTEELDRLAAGLKKARAMLV